MTVWNGALYQLGNWNLALPLPRVANNWRRGCPLDTCRSHMTQSKKALMLKPLCAMLCLLSPQALAAEWIFEGGGTPIAYFDNSDAQFQFACRGGDLAMAYWVRSPGAGVTGAQSMSLAITATGTAVSNDSATKFAQDLPVIHSDGSSVIVRGPVAQQWARIAQGARETIHLAYVRTKQDGGLEFLDRHSFSARGSAGAIAKVLAHCG